MSDPATESDLCILNESSVDRPVEQAHTGICDDNIRFFISSVSTASSTTTALGLVRSDTPCPSLTYVDATPMST